MNQELNELRLNASAIIRQMYYGNYSDHEKKEQLELLKMYMDSCLAENQKDIQRNEDHK